jgi:hypothetical protein
VHVESGKKPPPPQRKLYLYIEGSSKSDVANAYREIKRVLEDAAFSSLNIAGGYTGNVAKYSVVN